MTDSLHYAVSATITDLGEDVIQYIEFSRNSFLRQVDEITSNCPYTGYTRIGTLINTSMDEDIRIIGCPDDYPSLLVNEILIEFFMKKWDESNQENNFKTYLLQKQVLQNERLKIGDCSAQ